MLRVFSFLLALALIPSAFAQGLTSAPPVGITSIVVGSCLSVSGVGASNGTLAGNGTLTTVRPVNAQTGTSYTVVTGDNCKLVTLSNASSVAVTLPQAVTAFGSGWSATFANLGAGVVTITPTTSTIDGLTSIVLKRYQSATITSDGTNYATSRNRVPPWVITTISANDAAWPVPVGTTEMEIEAWGGGGSGAGGDTSTPGRGAGGASGGYCFKYYSGTMDATLAVTIGAGGAASPSGAGGNDGAAGGATSVVGTNLGTLTANGGGGGAKQSGVGGTGGTATGCDLNLQGAYGGVGFNSPSIFGVGGDAPRGGRGGAANIAIGGLIPGGGGSAGNHTSGSSGAGAAGRVVIRTR